MKRLTAIFILCIFLTGCLEYWFDREPTPVGELENKGVSKSRAEVVIERGKQFTDRVPFPWNLVAGAALVVAGGAAKMISDKRRKS